jgi:hypothetical protein
MSRLQAISAKDTLSGRSEGQLLRYHTVKTEACDRRVTKGLHVGRGETEMAILPRI